MKFSPDTPRSSPELDIVRVAMLEAKDDFSLSALRSRAQKFAQTWPKEADHIEHPAFDELEPEKQWALLRSETDSPDGLRGRLGRETANAILAVAEIAESGLRTVDTDVQEIIDRQDEESAYFAGHDD